MFTLQVTDDKGTLYYSAGTLQRRVPFRDFYVNCRDYYLDQLGLFAAEKYQFEAWLKENYRVRDFEGDNLVFDSEADAVMFVLRWS